MENKCTKIRVPETLMDKNEAYDVPQEQIDNLVEQAIALLEDYDYDVTEDGVRTVIEAWATSKGWLIKLLSEHENYSGNFQIVMPTTLKRPIDADGIGKFVDWATPQFFNKLPEKMIGMFTAVEYSAMKANVYRIIDRMDYLECPRLGAYRGRTYDEWMEEYNRMSRRLAECNEWNWHDIEYHGRTKKVSIATYNQWRAWGRIVSKLLLDRGKETPNIISKEDCECLNSHAENIGVPITEGLKVTKYIRKILVKYGIDKVVDIKTEEWMDSTTGEVRTRTADKGYNYYFALLGDSINPVDFPCEMVISVNPLDFWTMSFGYNWASCHTIDKDNRRGNESHNYHGCYSSGTESYMLDTSTIIVYSRPTQEQLAKKGEENLPMELQSKMKRCVFYLGEDKLVQSRLYPDGRDDGDKGLAAQFRSVVQSVIAGLYNTPNLWVLKKGTNECCAVVNSGSGATNYPDYENYSDCNVSYLRRVDGLLNTRTIEVGTAPICPSCGETHSDAEWIVCEDCREEHITCAECGARVDRDYAIEINGHYYCDTDCAYNAGYVDTVDDGWNLREDCRQESVTGDWYYYTGEGIETVDDEWFHNSDTACENGYSYCDYDYEWAPEDDVYEIGNTGLYFNCQNYDYIEAEDGRYFPDADVAEENGYHRLEDGSWTNEEVA